MLEIVWVVGSASFGHPFANRASYTALAVIGVYNSVVRKCDSAWLGGFNISMISANNLGSFSSTLGLRRVERLLIQSSWVGSIPDFLPFMKVNSVKTYSGFGLFPPGDGLRRK